MKVKENILIVSPTWLGDCIMAMPAIQALKRSDSTPRITILAKKQVMTLWQLNPAADEIIELPVKTRELIRTALEIRQKQINRAYILPHSFRSAFIPFLAGIPDRYGMPGHMRDRMLTRIITAERETHQAQEYAGLLGVSIPQNECAEIKFSQEALTEMRSAIPEHPGKLIAIMPGAAFGSAKRWPPENFIKTAAGLRKHNYRIILLGSASEQATCLEIAKTLGPDTINLAGQTDIEHLAAALSLCDLVIANDSGGAHLAAAVKTPVIVIFGATDPAKTAPYSETAHVIQQSTVRGRDMVKNTNIANAALKAIDPESVTRKAVELLNS